MYHKSYRQFRGNRFIRSKNRFNSHGRNQPKTTIAPAQYVNKSAVIESVPNIEIKHKFTDFSVDQKIKQNIINKGYNIPTPIQDQAIEHILNGRDVVGIANTGTGKTAAFLIPLINKIIHNRSEKVLIMVPTRELAVQICEELEILAKNLNISSILTIGGANINRQINTLRQNPSVVIGTPGRLKDLLTRNLLNLSLFNNVVLDEVDRMVDIGFIHDIRLIISLLPQNRQSLFFSATVSSQTSNIIQAFLKNPVTVSVKVSQTAKGIEQDIIKVKDKDEKVARLEGLLRLAEYKKVLVFGRTKWGVEKLSRNLQQKGFTSASIHGNKSQNQRLWALNQFKQNQLQVLVATDVAARGLDIEDVSHVINFDEPSTYTDYIHRIGRTGRANKQGKALTFVL